MYQKLQLPDNWCIVWTPPLWGFQRKCNIGLREFPNEPWYAFSGDDGIGRTPDWDTKLADIAMQGCVAWADDMNGGRCTQPFIYGPYVQDLGWLCHPALRHLYCDTVWERIATALKLDRYRPDIIQENLHFSNGKVPWDKTCEERQEGGDHAAWLRIDFAPLIAKVSARFESLCR